MMPRRASQRSAAGGVQSFILLMGFFAVCAFSWSLKTASGDQAAEGTSASKVADPGPGAAALTDHSRSNMRQLAVAMLQYIVDYDDVLPPIKSAASLKPLLFPYCKTDLIFTNPIDGKPYLPNSSISRRHLGSFDSPATMVVYYEDAPAPDGTRGVSYLDGHVKRVPETDWPRIKAAAHVPDRPPGAR